MAAPSSPNLLLAENIRLRADLAKLKSERAGRASDRAASLTALKSNIHTRLREYLSRKVRGSSLRELNLGRGSFGFLFSSFSVECFWDELRESDCISGCDGEVESEWELRISSWELMVRLFPPDLARREGHDLLKIHCYESEDHPRNLRKRKLADYLGLEGCLREYRADHLFSRVKEKMLAERDCEIKEIHFIDPTHSEPLVVSFKTHHLYPSLTSVRVKFSYQRAFRKTYESENFFFLPKGNDYVGSIPTI